LRLTLLLFAIALTACAAPTPATVQVVITASAGDVLPAEAIRILDRETATAAAAGTQAALATAGELAARATATTAALQTRDAMAIEQTRVALQLTAGAGAALATDAAAVRTASAQATQVAHVQALDATRAAATPTAAALATQNAYSATQRAQDAAQREAAGQFWDWVRWTTVISIISLAATFCVVVLVRGIAYVWVEYQREQAAIARDAFRLLAPGHWAEYVPGDGYQVYPLPALLSESATIIENVVSTPSRVHAWRYAARRFAFLGDTLGFGVRDLGPAGAGVVSDPAWRVMVRLFKRAGILEDRTVPGIRGRVTAWADGWDFRRLEDELRRGDVLPFPTDADPPAVAQTPIPTTPQPTQHTTTPQEG
jgi:hypothetical protein